MTMERLSLVFALSVVLASAKRNDQQHVQVTSVSNNAWQMSTDRKETTQCSNARVQDLETQLAKLETQLASARQECEQEEMAPVPEQAKVEQNAPNEAACAPFEFQGMIQRMSGQKIRCSFGKGGGKLSAMGSQCVGKQGGASVCKSKRGSMPSDAQCISINNKCAMEKGNIIYTKQEEMAAVREQATVEPNAPNEAREQEEMAPVPEQAKVEQDAPNEAACAPFEFKGMIQRMGGQKISCGFGKGGGDLSAMGSQCVGKQGGASVCKSKRGSMPSGAQCISINNKCAMENGNIIYTK